MYDVFGRTKSELDQFSGFRGSRPVRCGNGAHGQVQLDVYSGVISAAAEYAEAGGRLQSDQLKLLAGFGKTVCKIWREPDHGIWEIRALDCLVRLCDQAPVPIDRQAIAKEREAIRASIEESAWSEQLSAYSGVWNDDWVDASLLLMSCLGYHDAAHPRMRATVDTIRDKLGCNGLIYRYEQG